MKCPKCTSNRIIQNGHAPSGKRRWKCKNCQISFDNNTGKDYPATTIPFPFIAFILYLSEGWSVQKTYQHVNYLIRLIQLNSNERPFTLGSVSYSTVYKWKNNYQNLLDETITFEEAKKYYFQLFTTEDCSQYSENHPPLKTKEEYQETTKSLSHMEALRKLQEIADLMQTDVVDYMQSNPEIIPLLIEHLKKEKELELL